MPGGVIVGDTGLVSVAWVPVQWVMSVVRAQIYFPLFVGHSELLMPSESAIKELYYDISFKTVHETKVPLKMRWSYTQRPFGETRRFKRITVGYCHLTCA